MCCRAPHDWRRRARHGARVRQRQILPSRGQEPLRAFGAWISRAVRKGVARMGRVRAARRRGRAHPREGVGPGPKALDGRIRRPLERCRLLRHGVGSHRRAAKAPEQAHFLESDRHGGHRDCPTARRPCQLSKRYELCALHAGQGARGGTASSFWNATTTS